MQVYQISIAAVCSLSWPYDRLIIQVLDDSTDLTIRVSHSKRKDHEMKLSIYICFVVCMQELVQEECQKWCKRGRSIHYISRDNRNGYKAGALKEAMELDYVKKCDYVAIFDADHEPPFDFLLRTIPFLMHNPGIALVQARWKFGNHLSFKKRFFFFVSWKMHELMSDCCSVNADECLMTRIQEMSLNYHFKVEQQSGSTTMEFFGFNGELSSYLALMIVIDIESELCCTRNCWCLENHSH